MVSRLHYLRVSEGLTDLPPMYVCDFCLDEIRVRAANDPALYVTEISSRMLV